MNSLKKMVKETDWVFLIFFLLLINQSNFSLKTVAILFIYLARPNFKFGVFKGRMPKFYLAIVCLSLINYLFFIRDFTPGYTAAFSMSMLLWVYAFLTYHQAKLSIERKGDLLSTIKVFTLMNFAVTLGQLFVISIRTGRIDPFLGLDFPYGVSTGDNLFGVLLQNSHYNAMISCFAAIYFLYRKEVLFSFISVVVVTLVFANAETIIFGGTLFLVLVARILAPKLNRPWFTQLAPPSNAVRIIPAIWLFIFALSLIVSPDNVRYTLHTITARFIKNNEFSPNGKQSQIDVENKIDQHGASSDEIALNALNAFNGKKLALHETIRYASSSTTALFFGAGPSRFSSLTAQKMSGFDSSRLFKMLPKYSSDLYRHNHEAIIRARVKSSSEYFSNRNWPDSLYNQMLGEYGLLGIMILLVYYVGYFWKNREFISYGFWISLALLPLAHFAYIFDALCVMPFYELLMEQDIALHKTNILANG